MPFLHTIRACALAFVLGLLGCFGGTAQAAVVTVSGTAQFNEAGAAWAECDGLTANISLSINGAAKQSVPCARATGAFTFSANLTTADVPLTIFLDPSTPGSRGMVVTRNLNTTNSITGLTVVQDRAIMRSESATSMDNNAIVYTSANDSDVPVAKNGCSLSFSSDVVLVVDSGETYTSTCDVVTWSIAVRGGGNFDGQWSWIRLYGSGSSGDCTLGANVSMPLCIAPTGTFTPTWGGISFEPADGGDIVVPAQSYWSLEFRGNVLNTARRVPRVTLGTGAGQAIVASSIGSGAWCGPGCPEPIIIDFNEWAPSIEVWEGIGVGRNSRWEGSKPVTIRTWRYFEGSGTVDLPGADVTITADDSVASFGPGGAGWERGVDWTVRSVTMSSTYVRPSFGAGSGVTTAWNSGGVQTDAAAGVAGIDGNITLLGTLNTASAARGFVTQWWMEQGNGVPASCGPSPQAAVWNSGLSADTALGTETSGSHAYQWGTNAANGTDGTVRRVNNNCTYDDAFGTNDSTDVGGGSDFIRVDYDNNAVGFDEPRFVTYETRSGAARIDVVGTFTDAAGSNTRDFGAIRYAGNGAVLGAPEKLLWNSAAGAADNVTGGCYDGNFGLLYIVGTIPSNGGDIAMKVINVNDWTWGSNWGNADLDPAVPGNDTFVYNSGGANADAGGQCSVWGGGGVLVSGSSAIGGNTSTIVTKSIDGVLDPLFGTAGVATFDMGAGIAETPRAMTWDGNGMVIGGRSSANGGDEFLVRLDPDGDVDTTYWRGGGEAGGPNGDGVLVPSTAATDSSVGGMTLIHDGRVFVARSDGSTGGGDISLEGYDGAGDARTTPDAPGRTRIIGASGHVGNSTTLHVTSGLTVGTATGAGVATIQFDLEAYDLGLEVDDVTLIRQSGWLRGSSDRVIRTRNDFVNLGTYTANRGTVDLSGAELRSEVRSTTVSGVHNSFYNLRAVSLPGSAQAQKILAFYTVVPTRITNSLMVRGSDCSGRIAVTSMNAGTPATIDTTGATRALEFLDFHDTTLTPVGTFPNVNLVSGNTGITASAPCGAASIISPNGFYADDTNAQTGSIHNANITSQTPKFSWFSRMPAATKQHIRVYSDMIDNDVLGLWRLDGTGANLGVGGTALAPDASPNNPSYTASGRFGQALNFTGNHRATIPSNAAYDTRTFTVDTWFKSTSIANSAYPTLLSRIGPTEQFEMGFDRGINCLYVEVESGGVWKKIDFWAPPVLDGNWHHVAMTSQAVSSTQWKVSMFVDGKEQEAFVFTGTGDIATGSPIRVGNSNGLDQPFLGQIDEPRFVGRALGPDEIMGWYKTSRPHGDLVWESSPGGVGVNFPGNVSVNTGARTPDITYGGPAGSLVLDGARYYAQVRFANAGSTWSNWNPGDWFSTRASISIANVSGANVNLGPVVAGSEVAASADFQVTTSSGRGYSLAATTQADGRGMWNGVSVIPPWTGTNTTPTTWPAGTPGFGLTNLVSPGKDTSRWGAGSTPTDYANLKYAGLSHSAPTVLATRTGYSAATDTVTLGLRLSPTPTARPGSYTTHLTITAVANP